MKEKLYREAKRFRELLEISKSEDIPLVLEEFPVMACKLSSILFAYHLINIFPWAGIYGVSGFAKDRHGCEVISHYWLEIENIAIDITFDQYNVIDVSELNSSIVKNRPFQPVYVDMVGEIPAYKLFSIKNRDKYVQGFPELTEDFLENLHLSYERVINAKVCT